MLAGLKIKEELLQFIWKYTLFNFRGIQSDNGETLQIIQSGEHNKNAGPDFLNAKIKIDKTTWAGNVEIHLKTSDWFRHGHQNDKAYSNVILHVVYENDITEHHIPILELKPLIHLPLLEKYEQLQKSRQWIPCSSQTKSVNTIHIKSWLHRVAVERLENKITSIEKVLERNKNSWEQTLYELTARSFGFKLNSEPFEMLARSLDLKILAKHKDSLFQIESLLFGQSGLLLPKHNDEYPDSLKKEYAFLRKKYHLQPLKGESWKFLRLRPYNFPTIRIAQFAALVYSSNHLFSKILEADSLKNLTALLQVNASNYWKYHYNFESFSRPGNKKIGKTSIQSIITNAFIPTLFLYGKLNSGNEYCDRAVHFLDELSPESNTIINNWKDLGIKANSSLESQALIQLKHVYCDNKKCLECGIGSYLLRQ